MMREHAAREAGKLTTQVVAADMQRHDIPFTADNFAIWHCYMGGANASLRRTIDIVLSNGLALDDRMLAALYARHFCQAREVRALGDAVAASMAAYAASDRLLYGLDPPDAVMAGHARLGQALGAVDQLAAQILRQLGQSEDRISQLETVLEDARREARTDCLTAIANRRAFDAELRARAGEAMNGGCELGFVLIDIDHFKQVNDRWGHGAGDAVLCATASLLASTVRKTDFVGRYGGEEFAVILPGADEGRSMAVAESLREAVAALRVRPGAGGRASDEAVRVTVSAGVACYDHGERLGDWLERADRALYGAKNAGRNRIGFAPRHEAASRHARAA